LSVNGMPFLQVLAGPTWMPEFRRRAAHPGEKLKGRDAFRDLLLPVQVQGEERWWEIAASPRFDERGAFIGFRGVGSGRHRTARLGRQDQQEARFDTLRPAQSPADQRSARPRHGGGRQMGQPLRLQ